MQEVKFCKRKKTEAEKKMLINLMFSVLSASQYEYWLLLNKLDPCMVYKKTTSFLIDFRYKLFFSMWLLITLFRNLSERVSQTVGAAYVNKPRSLLNS